MLSHDSTPTMSGLLLDFLQTRYQIKADDETDDSTLEQTHLKIQTDNNGNLISKNQVLDYSVDAVILVTTVQQLATKCSVLNPAIAANLVLL